MVVNVNLVSISALAHALLWGSERHRREVPLLGTPDVLYFHAVFDCPLFSLCLIAGGMPSLHAEDDVVDGTDSLIEAITEGTVDFKTRLRYEFVDQDGR